MRREISCLFLLMIGLPLGVFLHANPKTQQPSQRQQGRNNPAGFKKLDVIQGLPYSATVTYEWIYNFSSGTHLIQTRNGTNARDSQGRTREEDFKPSIYGALAASTFIQFARITDPVAQVHWTLNLTEKTASRFPYIYATPRCLGCEDFENRGSKFTEDLGSKFMEGLEVIGTRTTHTEPVGQANNLQPTISIQEIWTAPDLKTIIFSKFTSPNLDELTFRLSNIKRDEPDPALFTAPTDFEMEKYPKIVNGTMQ